MEAVDNTRCSATRAVRRVRPPCPPLCVPRACGQLCRSPEGPWSSSLRWGGTRKRPWNQASSVHLGPRCKPGRKLPKETGWGVIDALSCLGQQPGFLSWRRRPAIPGERDYDKDAEKKSGVSRSWEWGGEENLPGRKDTNSNCQELTTDYMSDLVLKALRALSHALCILSRVAQMVNNLPAMQETQVHPCIRKILWRREWQSTPVFFPGEFHGQRSLVGHGPWGHKESDTTKRLTLLHYYLVIEGRG